MARISMRLDVRAASLARPRRVDQAGRVGWWMRFSSMAKGKRISIPLLTYEYHEARTAAGRVINGVLVSEDRKTGALSFGVVTDIGEACVASRAAYTPEREVLPVDFGLSTMFATGEGDLLGRGWLDALKRHDARITRIARGMQRRGRKPRESARYRAAVTRLRGWIRTEVNRVLNRLVAGKQPAMLVLERLDFRNPSLSRRLNRLVQNCGRSVIRAKLADLKDRFGIEAEEVNPAYTSQTCSSCGYVDKRNRASQSGFCCRWCGDKMHADGNAARNIGARRARPIGSVYRPKAHVLRELVRQFSERRVFSTRTGGRGSTADPRLTNPYFKGVIAAARIPGSAQQTPDVVPAERT